MPNSAGFRENKERVSDSCKGVALVLVMLVIALASIIVINLTYSTHLDTQTSAMIRRGLQAEYLLKSTLNFARALLREDTSPEDGSKDTWAKFANGMDIPPELLGIKEPNIRIALEIRPEDAAIPIQRFANISATSQGVDILLRDSTVRLFRTLGFDDDEDQIDQTGIFPDRHFVADELVAVLIDYMDSDEENYNPGNFAEGVESNIPKEIFPNRSISRSGELGSVPGFTPARLRALLPFITVRGSQFININFAPAPILLALDDTMSDASVQEIIAFREGENGPFTPSNKNAELDRIVGESIRTKIQTLLSTGSNWFQVLAKVDYGVTSYFMRAVLNQQADGELPLVKSVELF